MASTEVPHACRGCDTVGAPCTHQTYTPGDATLRWYPATHVHATGCDIITALHACWGVLFHYQSTLNATYRCNRRSDSKDMQCMARRGCCTHNHKTRGSQALTPPRTGESACNEKTPSTRAACLACLNIVPPGHTHSLCNENTCTKNKRHEGAACL